MPPTPFRDHPSWAPKIAPRSPQEAPRSPPETPSSRQDGQDRSKIALRGPPDRFPTPQDRPKKAQERSKSDQERSWNHLGAILGHFGAILGSKMCVFPYVFQYFLCIRVFDPKSFPKASWSPICANLGGQERPKSGQEGSWNHLGAILRHFEAILGSKMCVSPCVFQYFL